MPSKSSLHKLLPKLVTFVVVAVAATSAYFLYQRYQQNPWTRDAQLRADIVQIAPRVGGYLVEVGVADNQSVQKGDLLFKIDPRPYQLAVDQAEIALDQARESVTQLEAAVRAADANVKQSQASATSAKSRIIAAEASLDSADAAIEEAKSSVKSAEASVARVTAQLDEAGRQAERVQKLADVKAGSVQTAQASEASRQSYEAEVEGATAGLRRAEAGLAKSEAAKREAEANLVIAQNGLAEAEAGVLTATADLDRARAALGQTGDANVQVRAALARVEQAKLNLEWTSIYAPADGFISNMNLSEATFVTTGAPFALFVDSSSFRVDAYFQETKLRNIQPGDRTIVTLMGHTDRKLEAEVESIGFAINPPKTAQMQSPGNLVPTIQPTFEWIRLAQRVPVRIRFIKIPQDIHLVSGMTASVAVRKGSNGDAR